MNSNDNYVGISQNSKNLVKYLEECIEKWIDENNTDRIDVIFALFNLCFIIFHLNSSDNVTEKHKEIDAFCHTLKRLITEDLNKI